MAPFVLERKIVWAPWKYSGHKDLYLTTGRLVSAGEGTEIYATTRPRRRPLRIYALACALYFALSMAIGWDKVAQGNTAAGATFAIVLALVFVLPPALFMWIEEFRRKSFLKRVFKAFEGQ